MTKTISPSTGLGNPGTYLLATVGCIILEGITVFDRFAQRAFFRGTWAISKSFHNGYKHLLYTGPKIAIIAVGICLLALLISTFVSLSAGQRFMQWRKPVLLVLCSLALVPLFVAILKGISGVYSPVDLVPYGGKFPHIGVIEQLYRYGEVAGGRSFPAGHASGGFALMALYYLPVRDAGKKGLFAFGLIAGWAMGIYQMARGEHFLSHTMTSMFLALAIITLLERVLRTAPREAT